MSLLVRCRSATSVPYNCRTAPMGDFAMARTVRNPRLNTRSARIKLVARREPFWMVISEGCALGYRRGRNGGARIAQFRGENGRRAHEGVGAPADGRAP